MNKILVSRSWCDATAAKAKLGPISCRQADLKSFLHEIDCMEHKCKTIQRKLKPGNEALAFTSIALSCKVNEKLLITFLTVNEKNELSLTL